MTRRFCRLFPVLLSWVGYISANATAADCAALQSTLRLENTTIIAATYVPGGSNVTTPGSCQTSASVATSICRVQFVVQTTAKSQVYAEVWLPDEWYGRFLAIGNDGVGGCIEYSNVDYGTSLHFATVGSDNGHDGANGTVFKEPEVVNDFAFRAIHVEAVIGKQIVEAYYKRAYTKSYYLGCSTGGRQGTQAALKYPDDFDGILAGAPATDWNHLSGWWGMLGRFVGAPNPSTSPSFIPVALWNIVAAEILRQCDGLDGVMDKIITEPDDCHFSPSVLLCSPNNTVNCLSEAQVAALQNIYSPLIGAGGQLMYPRYDPGTDVNEGQGIFGGSIIDLAQAWYPNTIFNNTNYNFSNFDLSAIVLADSINPGGIATFNGDLSAFKNRGGKFISFHGRHDPIIASGNSKRMYNLISTTMGMQNLDPFYRLFLVPGMSHCAFGLGAWAFGQIGQANGPVNATGYNVLLSLVDWVEGGVTPETVIGTATDGTHRIHCRYPQRSVWNGTMFECQV